MHPMKVTEALKQSPCIALQPSSCTSVHDAINDILSLENSCDSAKAIQAPLSLSSDIFSPKSLHFPLKGCKSLRAKYKQPAMARVAIQSSVAFQGSGLPKQKCQQEDLGKGELGELNTKSEVTTRYLAASKPP